MNALGILNQTLVMRMSQCKPPVFGWKRAPQADHTAVVCHGGIGDLILAIGPAEVLNHEVGDVVIYTHWPEIAEYFTTLPCRSRKEIDKVGLDCVLNINSLALFQFSGNFKGFHNKKLAQVFVRTRHFLTQGSWPMIAELHPHLDQLLGKEAVKLGLKRWNITYACLGYDTDGIRYRYRIRPKMIPGKYITIHDGFDANNIFKSHRATKTWNMEGWKTLVRHIKQTFPDYKIVQLGGPQSRRIPGVDVDKVDNQSFTKSLDCLANSSLHIDGDSGLTHAARVLGVKTVALYGPSPVDFFGYPENENISPHVCGGCWWLTLDWIANCPAKYESPECMDSITAKEVFARVKKCL